MFRVRGVPIRAHWTLLLIIPYLAIAMTSQFRELSEVAGVHARLILPPIVWGCLLAIALFASVALHELGHTWVALRAGGKVHSITLMLVGGVSQMSRAPARPRDEALMALAGPVTSFVIAAVCGGIYLLARGIPDLAVAMFYLGAMNTTLALFNLVPAFPMDGGRILRALLATRLGHARATQIAAAVGKVCAVIFGAIAVVTASLLLGIIALFVYVGAAGELAAERTHSVLDGLTVGELLPADRLVPTVAPSDSIETAVRRMRELDRLAVLVVDPRGRPLRVIEADELARLALLDGAEERLDSATLHTPSKLVAVSIDGDANAALAALAEARADYLVPIDPITNTVAGLLGPQELARAVKLRALGASRFDIAHPHALH
jgi:Zn-dependent protease/CBS domain-containing protein